MDVMLRRAADVVDRGRDIDDGTGSATVSPTATVSANTLIGDPQLGHERAASEAVAPQLTH
jgi:hypothetical protein